MPIEKLTSEAKEGNSESQYLLGRAYDEGKLVSRNLKEAISWYQKAADQGHPLACDALGIECTSSGADNGQATEHRITKIYGPPGTGKTTKLIELIREAIGSGVEPDMIGFFSFTNKATEEAKSPYALGESSGIQSLAGQHVVQSLLKRLELWAKQAGFQLDNHALDGHEGEHFVLAEPHAWQFGAIGLF